MELLGQQPWHPFLVHFPIAAWTLGALALGAGVAFRVRFLVLHGWLLLAVAALMSVPAALSGQSDYQKLAALELPALTLHRNLGVALPWLMAAAVLSRAHFALRKKGAGPPEWPWAVYAVAVSVLLLYAAWLGGRTVYGLGA